MQKSNRRLQLHDSIICRLKETWCSPRVIKWDRPQDLLSIIPGWIIGEAFLASWHQGAWWKTCSHFSVSSLGFIVFYIHKISQSVSQSVTAPSDWITSRTRPSVLTCYRLFKKKQGVSKSLKPKRWKFSNVRRQDENRPQRQKNNHVFDSSLNFSLARDSLGNTNYGLYCSRPPGGVWDAAVFILCPRMTVFHRWTVRSHHNSLINTHMGGGCASFGAGWRDGRGGVSWGGGLLQSHLFRISCE